MSTHPVLSQDKVAVITGGADGIGLATARHCLTLGMRVCIADLPGDALTAAASDVDGALGVACDVADLSAVQSLRDTVYDRFGQVDLLMNNAGAGFGATPWTEYDNWRRTIDVNLMGVVNGLQTFIPPMLAQASPGLVVNTGSKQGITNPPGDAAYNASKAAIKSLTEQLAHSFRNTEDCQLSAHLLIPGYTYTGLVRKWLPEKPDAAWWPEQVVKELDAAIRRGDFYIICPDNDVARPVDNRRMEWSMGDLTHNRSALSRWDPDYACAFESFMDLS
ncbi:MAG: SDR family NAD(P)-dependent oxidoreductase [Pseudomonadota bacterium]